MILDNLEKIRYRLRAAAEKSGRASCRISLVAVTKYADFASLKELIESGLVSEIAENRVSDAEARKAALGALGARVLWRLIGHLQTNKVNLALRIFDAVDSVDSFRLASRLDAALSVAGRRLPVLVQVKLSGKPDQFGVAPEALGELLGSLQGLKRLDVRGLMAIAPELEPVEAVRPYFRRMRELFERFFSGQEGAQLSMGMSRDFEIAVEEGATMVRIGSALFLSQGGNA